MCGKWLRQHESEFVNWRLSFIQVLMYYFIPVFLYSCSVNLQIWGQIGLSVMLWVKYGLDYISKDWQIYEEFAHYSQKGGKFIS